MAAGKEFEDRKNLTLREITVGKNDKWAGKCLTEIPVPQGTLIVMIERGSSTIIPRGDTVIQEGIFWWRQNSERDLRAIAWTAGKQGKEAVSRRKDCM